MPDVCEFSGIYGADSAVVLGISSLLRMCMENAMAPHSSTLAWKIPWTEKPGRLRSMGLLGVGHDWATSLSLHWRRKWQPTPVFLPGESQGRGLPSMGSHGVGHNWSNLAAAAAAARMCITLYSSGDSLRQDIGILWKIHCAGNKNPKC